MVTTLDLSKPEEENLDIINNVRPRAFKMEIVNGVVTLPIALAIRELFLSDSPRIPWHLILGELIVSDIDVIAALRQAFSAKISHLLVRNLSQDIMEIVLRPVEFVRITNCIKSLHPIHFDCSVGNMVLFRNWMRHTPKLEELDFAFCNCTLQKISRLVHATPIRLKRVRVYGDANFDSDLPPWHDEWADMSKFENLEQLTVCDRATRDPNRSPMAYEPGIAELVGMENSKLVKFYLTLSSYRREFVMNLFAAFRRNPKLEHLILCLSYSSWVLPEMIDYLSHPNCRLKSLHLSSDFASIRSDGSVLPGQFVVDAETEETLAKLLQTRNARLQKIDIRRRRGTEPLDSLIPYCNRNRAGRWMLLAGSPLTEWIDNIAKISAQDIGRYYQCTLDEASVYELDALYHLIRQGPLLFSYDSSSPAPTPRFRRSKRLRR